MRAWSAVSTSLQLWMSVVCALFTPQGYNVKNTNTNREINSSVDFPAAYNDVVSSVDTDYVYCTFYT